MNSKVLLIIPDGVGIRNYLYSNIITHLKYRVELTFWSTLPKDAFKTVFEIHNCKAETKQIKLDVEGFITRLLRESSTFARLKSNSKKVNNVTILHNWNYKPKGIKRKMLNALSQIIGTWASSKYSRILYLERKAKSFWKRSLIEKHKADLKKLNPQSIFITHQRVSGLMPICIAAKELGIKIVSTIYSWDNIPKARLAIEADIYTVWSNYMKREMMLFYPEIGSNKIVVTGTPQFEFYLNKDRVISREKFAKKYGLDLNKKWICFSGDDIKTSPYDANYLNDVLEANQFIKDDIRPQIIFRRCPVDFSSRYDKALSTYNDVVSIDPLWHTPKGNDNWGAYFPKYEDINMQVNLAYHCDAVINLGSTMAHDFTMFNKPCFYLNYDPVKDNNWSVKYIYNFQHFRSMKELNAVEWLNSKEEIKTKMLSLISSSNTLSKEKKEWFKIVNLHPVDLNSKLIADVL